MNEGQASSVTSTMITDATIAAADLGQMGAAIGPGDEVDRLGVGAAQRQRRRWRNGDNAWVRGTPDSVLYTVHRLGVARGEASNMLYGSFRQSHVNLGVACTTGVSGQNYSNLTIGGGLGNTVGAAYSTVAGGLGNRAIGIGAAVAGGAGNAASGDYSSAVGGYGDTTLALCGGVLSGYLNKAGDAATDTCALVVGGYGNLATAKFAFVGGGQNDTASGNWSTVGGGSSNAATGHASTIGGGNSNAATGYASTIGGGSGNDADTNYATVSGGSSNTASGDYATVGGGFQNHASGSRATVGGGIDNYATISYATVGGGTGNNATGYVSTISGGNGNDADTAYATVGGGQQNAASGDASTVAGGGLDSSYRVLQLHDQLGVLWFRPASATRLPSMASGRPRPIRPGSVPCPRPRGRSLSTTRWTHPARYSTTTSSKGRRCATSIDGEAVLDAAGRAGRQPAGLLRRAQPEAAVQLTGVGSSDVYVAEEVSATGSPSAAGRERRSTGR